MSPDPDNEGKASLHGEMHKICVLAHIVLCFTHAMPTNLYSKVSFLLYSYNDDDCTITHFSLIYRQLHILIAVATH